MAQDLSDLNAAMNDSLRVSMKLDESWTHRDIPWMKQSLYNQLIQAIGKDHYRFVSGSTRCLGSAASRSAEIYIRASIFVDLQGMENLKNWLKTLEV